MTLAALVVALVAWLILCLTIIAVAIGRKRKPAETDGWLDQSIRARVSVHTVDGDTLDGLLLETDQTGLVLTDATFVAGGESTELAGDQFIPRDRVRFVQVQAT